MRGRDAARKSTPKINILQVFTIDLSEIQFVVNHNRMARSIKDVHDKDKKFFSEHYLSSARIDQHTGWQHWPSTSSSSWRHESERELEVSSLFFFCSLFFCYSWFRLQLTAIHCNRRCVWTEHPHTAYFLAHLHTFHPCSHAPHGSRCCSACLIKTCSSTCHHVSDRALSLRALTSSSLSSASTPSLISSSPLSWSSSSVWSKPPSTKSPAHPQNEEYCPVATQNPLTWQASNFTMIWSGQYCLENLNENLLKKSMSSATPQRRRCHTWSNWHQTSRMHAVFLGF